MSDMTMFQLIGFLGALYAILLTVDLALALLAGLGVQRCQRLLNRDSTKR